MLVPPRTPFAPAADAPPPPPEIMSAPLLIVVVPALFPCDGLVEGVFPEPAVPAAVTGALAPALPPEPPFLPFKLVLSYAPPPPPPALVIVLKTELDPSDP